MKRLVSLMLAGALAVLSGCAVNPATGDRDFVLMSEQEEVGLGAREHQKILRQYQPYADPELQAYVTEVGQRLAARSHRSGMTFRFTVLDSNEVNAFALPGGYVYITRGLMAYLNSEAELAAVLGHEIGHVTARHGVQQYSASTATGIGITLGQIFLPELRSRSSQELMNVLGTAFIRGYGREHELEADRLGAEYLVNSGFRSEAMLEVITVLKSHEVFEQQLAREQQRAPRSYHGVFSTHPSNDQRLQEVIRAARTLDAETSVAVDAGRERYRRRIEGMVFGPGSAEGVVRDNRFLHADLDLAVAFPEKWRVENQSERLIAVAPDEAAFIQMTAEPVVPGTDPARWLRDRVGSLRSPEPLRHDGFRGHTGLAILNTPFGRRLGRVAVLFRNEQAFVFIAAARDNNALSGHDRGFLDTIRSVHGLTVRERQAAEPLRVVLTRATGDGDYARLTADSPLPHHAEEQLRLLNGHYPDGQPETGELLKVVR